MTRHWSAFGFVSLVAAAFGAWFWLKPNPHADALRVRELATRSLAEFLARTHPGKRALIVSNPFTQQTGTAKAILETEQAGVRGLREGFGPKVTVAAVVFPELKPEAWENPRDLLNDADTTTPLSYLVAPEAFDKLARQHPDCELIVSLIGLPVELSRCEVWNVPGPPRFALLLPDLRMVGDAAAVQQALRVGNRDVTDATGQQDLRDGDARGAEVRSQLGDRLHGGSKPGTPERFQERLAAARVEHQSRKRSTPGEPIVGTNSSSVYLLVSRPA